MTRRLAIVALLAVTSCSRAPFQQSLDDARWNDAARIFAADPALMNDEHALYDAGMLFGSPTRPTYDPVRARELFRRLLARFPESRHRADASDRVALLDDLLMTRENNLARQRALEARIAQLTAEAEHLRATADSAMGQSDAARRSTAKLEGDLRERDEQLRVLRLELRRLKEIDLKPRQPGRQP